MKVLGTRKTQYCDLATNCSVNAEDMGDGSDGERDHMPWQEATRKRRDQSDSDFGEENKNVKVKKSSAVENDDAVEWKVVITFKKEGDHYHPLKLTKAIGKK